MKPPPPLRILQARNSDPSYDIWIGSVYTYILLNKSSF